MAHEGALGPGGVGDLLAALWDQGRTGILDLTLGAAQRRLVVSGGDVVYVSSSEAAERLPVRLVTLGLVERNAMVDAAKAGPDLRATLAARGLLAAEAHDAQLRALVAEIVVRLVPETSGKFTFVDRSDLKLEGMLPSLDMQPILWQGARKAPVEYVRGFLGPASQRVQRGAGDDVLQALPDLTPAEGFLISRIDGYGSLADLQALAPGDPDGLARLLTGLCLVGVVALAGRPSVRLPKAPAGSGKKRTAAPKPAAPKAAAPQPARSVLTPMAASGPVTAAGPPPGSPSTNLPAEGQEMLAAARDLRSRAAGLDHYGLLGVKATASDDEIRRAYYSLARTFHPDRAGKEADAAARDLVEDLFARVSEAFGVLSEPEARRTYDERLKSGAIAAEKQEKKVDPKDMARESHARGRAALATGDRGQATRFFEHAVNLDPDNFEYRMALGRLLASDPRTRRKAEPHFQEAIRIDQSKADAYYELGVLYRAASMKTRAAERLREGLKWDASHEGILSELAALDSEDGEAARGGLFGRKK